MTIQHGMRRGALKGLFKSQIKKLLATVTDESVRKLMERDILLCGGAIASGLLGDKINDYDCYFRTRETALAVARYYVAKFTEKMTKGTTLRPGVVYVTPKVREIWRKNLKGEDEHRIVIYMKSSGVAGKNQSDYKYFESRPEGEADEFFSSLSTEEVSSEIGRGDLQDDAEELVKTARIKEQDYHPVFMSENAISLSGRFQLVIRFFGTPEEIHKNYDYAHAMCCYDYRADSLLIHEDAMESMLSRNLIYRGSLYPVASIFRVRKFLQRGWRISAGQMLKIMHQIAGLDFNDTSVLREQLIGVDTAYMGQLLTALENNKSDRIDGAYLAKLIDEIFE